MTTNQTALYFNSMLQPTTAGVGFINLTLPKNNTRWKVLEPK
jgi:hypothetical protein